MKSTMRFTGELSVSHLLRFSFHRLGRSPGIKMPERIYYRPLWQGDKKNKPTTK